MVDYREILRLDNLGYTKKDIASSVHSSRNTVSEVLTLAGNLHVCWPLDDDVTNQSLENLFYPGPGDGIRIMRNDLCPIIRKFTGNSPRKALPLHYFGQNTVWKPALLAKSHI